MSDLTRTQSKSLTAVAFGCLIAILLTPFSLLLYAWVLSILWGWFIIPVFDVDPLSIPLAIGLSLVSGMFRSSPKPTNNESKDAVSLAGWAFGVMFLQPLILLLFGWIVTWFM